MKINMQLRLKEKNAIVSGGSKGIGRAIAHELAALGANVTLLARTESTLVDCVNALPCSEGQSHAYHVVDYDRPETLKNVLTSSLANQDYHILINNAGGPPGGPLVAADLGQLDTAIHRHLHSAHLLVQHVFEGMKSSGYGRIINIISTSVKQPIPGLGVSNTTRGAVANWAKTLASELGPFGITVNNVLPGATLTDRLSSLFEKWAQNQGISVEEYKENAQKSIPLQRFAQPEEIAAAVAFLASPAAAYINGINLPVDGGRTKSL